MSKDYYKILGVAEFDSAENIKTAYRKLARKWHPDVAGNSADAILKFKEINEAYQILSDNVKKSEYDKARRFYSYAKGEKSEEKSSFSFNWKKTKETLNPKRGEDVYTDVEITILEAINGCNKTINMLQTRVCPKCNGKKFINGSICKHCLGKGEFTNYKKFTVKIPAGVKDKSKIRLAGEGTLGENGGKSGDLYITIHLKAESNYKTEGLDIVKTVPITPYEAVLGGDITIASPSGNITIKLAPNTQNGQKIRLSKCGIVQNNNVGDMIVTIEIQIPNNLTNEEINLYKKLKEISSGIYDR